MVFNLKPQVSTHEYLKTTLPMEYFVNLPRINLNYSHPRNIMYSLVF